MSDNSRKYIIIPGCSDLNRGDQALVWETKRLAEDCGYKGDFYLTSEKNEPVEQSKLKGIKIISPIIEHPSRKFKSKENISYTKMLKIKWGFVAIIDFIGSLFILNNITRNFIKIFLSPEKRETLDIFEESRALFMKGGGLLQTYGGFASTYSMYFWVYPLLLAHNLHKPVYVMPNSFGPFKGPFVKKIARYALKKCRVVTSRESYSEKMVKEKLNIKIQTYPDLAFTLPMANLNKNDIYLRYSLPKDRKLVAITMRPYRFPGTKNPKEAYELFKTEMAIFIDWLYDKGYMPVIIEHTLAINAHENDGACIRDVINKISSNKYRVISNKNFDCQDLKCIYSYCEYIIGTRFHSVIFSFGCDVPGIAIAYTGNKSQGIMHDMGLDDYVVQISDVRASLLKEKFSVLVKNQKRVKEKIKSYRNKAEKERKILMKICAYKEG